MEATTGFRVLCVEWKADFKFRTAMWYKRGYHSNLGLQCGISGGYHYVLQQIGVEGHRFLD